MRGLSACRPRWKSALADVSANWPASVSPSNSLTGPRPAPSDRPARPGVARIIGPRSKRPRKMKSLPAKSPWPCGLLVPSPTRQTPRTLPTPRRARSEWRDGQRDCRLRRAAAQWAGVDDLRLLAGRRSPRAPAGAGDDPPSAALARRAPRSWALPRPSLDRLARRSPTHGVEFALRAPAAARGRPAAGAASRPGR